MRPIVSGTMRKVLAVLVFLLLIAAGAWVWAGRQDGPTLTFTKPGAFTPGCRREEIYLMNGSGTGIRTPVPWLRTTCPDP